MRRILIFLFCMAFACANTLAQEDEGDGLLFRISSKDLKTPSYIVGSFHLVDGKDVHQLGAFDSIYARVPQVCFETEMDKTSSLVSSKPKKPGSFEAMDYYVYDEAVKDNKKIFHLESIEVQDSILKKMMESQKKQTQTLGITARKDSAQQISPAEYYQQLQKLRDQIVHMRQLYMQGKCKELLSELATTSQNENRVDKKVDSRNDAWLQKMPDIMKSGSTLFIVGIAHVLPYKNSAGLLAGLQKMGYKIEKVKP